MRIDSLDYLRGLMALLIMLYHFFSWTFGTYLSETLLGIFGIYGVSTFYVLSGLTLYLVYNEKLNFGNLYKYAIRRFFRIYPLLWVSIFFTIFLLNKSYEFDVILYNITGIFGFIAHDKYIPTGAWSIGNELVYYSIFPIIMIGSKRYKHFILASFIFSLLIAIYFAFFVLTDTQTLQEQWKDYVNPFNQLFFFVGGICMGRYFKINNNKLSILLLIIAFSFFMFYPVNGNKINITSGINRILFALCTFCITQAFFTFNFDPSIIIRTVLRKIGHISYSIYLIHPIVFWYGTKFMNRTETPVLFLLVSMSITIGMSLLIYELIEKRFIQLGKSLSTFNIK